MGIRKSIKPVSLLAEYSDLRIEGLLLLAKKNLENKKKFMAEKAAAFPLSDTRYYRGLQKEVEKIELWIKELEAERGRRG